MSSSQISKMSPLVQKIKSYPYFARILFGIFVFFFSIFLVIPVAIWGIIWDNMFDDIRHYYHKIKDIIKDVFHDVIGYLVGMYKTSRILFLGGTKYNPWFYKSGSAPQWASNKNVDKPSQKDLILSQVQVRPNREE